MGHCVNDTGDVFMAFVVCEPCIKCKYTECVTVCPVDCFHEGENMLVIDPVECIDCGVCVEECPVRAIYCDEEVPEKWQDFIALNAAYAPKWPVLRDGKGPLPSAEEWSTVTDKRQEFIPRPGKGS